MKLSVSLPDEDVAFLDSYAKSRRVDSRSAVVRKAVQLLRASELEAAYEQAWGDRAGSESADEWDVVVSDGLTDAPR